jgi:transposase
MTRDNHSGLASRLEVVELGRRRRWRPDEKAAIVEESFSGRASVCAVARRHGIAPGQLFTWRRDARVPAPAGFAPVMITDDVDRIAEAPPREPRDVIVVELGGGRCVRIGAAAPAELVTAALRALR